VGRAIGPRVPQAWTCAEVLADPGKLERLSAAVLEELKGLEESQRKIGIDDAEMVVVRERYPGGVEQVAPLIAEACRAAAANDKAFGVAFRRLEKPPAGG
jgi:hypothetical protein